MDIKTTNIVTDIVELSTEDRKNLPKEVFAAISKNPTLKWIKFILTDDAPNANRQRIPVEEFANLVRTGVHMPIKMSQGYVRDGHEYSVPIGSIATLVEREHHVEGIAGLWRKEFPGEIDLLEEMTASDNKPQLSWELLYKASVIEDEGVEAFHNVALAAATVVGIPAYEGRTPIVLMASKQESDADYKIKLEEYDKMEEKLKELQSQVNSLTETNKELETNFATLKEEHDTLKGDMEKVSAEKDELAEFKSEIDAEKAEAEKLASILKLFEDAELAVPDEYLEDEEKKANLLDMDTKQLEFFLHEISLFASLEEGEEEGEEEEGGEEEASKHIGSKIRLNPKAEKSKDLSSKDIAEALKSRDGGK